MTRQNITSKPPLTQDIVDDTGKPTKTWAIWFRDMFDRVANKESNSIDDLDERVTALEERVTALENP